jgi:hypothetical protein
LDVLASISALSWFFQPEILALNNFDQLFQLPAQASKALNNPFFGEEFNGDILLLWLTPRRNTLDSSVIEEILGVVL